MGGCLPVYSTLACHASVGVNDALAWLFAVSPQLRHLHPVGMADRRFLASWLRRFQGGLLRVTQRGHGQGSLQVVGLYRGLPE